MNPQRLISVAKIAGAYLGVFALFLLGNYLVLQRTSGKQAQQDIDSSISRIKNDLRYVNGKWDTSLYNADPDTTYPNSSSSHPLAIITVDGFVIEQSKPIGGFFDSADFVKLLTFQTPQTINTLANEQWRVYAQRIDREGKTVGVVIVSYYNPDTRILPEIDKKLTDSAAHINEQISYSNNAIHIDRLDIRNIHYDVAFEVVNSFNKVIVNNGRSPSYIDRSYVADAMKSNAFRQIRDTTTNEPFLVRVEPIVDDKGNPQAIVAVGSSVLPQEQLIQQFLTLAGLAGIAVFTPIVGLIIYSLRRDIGIALALGDYSSTEQPPTSVIFHEATSTIEFHDQMIEIPEKSHQYYLCHALFADPKREWEADDLLGEIDGANGLTARKLYDAAVAINKKMGFKLIEYREKAFSISPTITAVIST